MPKGFPIDLDELHARLWERTDRLGRIKLTQSKLAAELGITKYTMSRVVAKLIEDGCIRQISSRGNNAGRFIVTDPSLVTQ